METVGRRLEGKARGPRTGNCSLSTEMSLREAQRRGNLPICADFQPCHPGPRSGAGTGNCLSTDYRHPSLTAGDAGVRGGEGTKNRLPTLADNALLGRDLQPATDY
jgi:hypothetical protein